MGCPLGPNVEPAAKKTSSRYGLPTLFQPGLPSLGSPHWAHNKPMWASSWAAHLGLTWSLRPKIHRADMGCLHCSNLGCPVWAAHNKPMWASSWAAHLGLTGSPRQKKHRADMGCLHCSNLGCPVWAAHIGPTISPCGLVYGLPTWAYRGARGQKNIEPICAPYTVPT